MKVRLEGSSDDRVYAPEEMPILTMMILVKTPSDICSKAGDPVVKTTDGRLIMPKTKTHASIDHDYLARHLRPGERLVFEGE